MRWVAFVEGTCACGPPVNAQRIRPHMPGNLRRGGPYKRGLLYYKNRANVFRFVNILKKCPKNAATKTGPKQIFWRSTDLDLGAPPLE